METLSSPTDRYGFESVGFKRKKVWGERGERGQWTLVEREQEERNMKGGSEKVIVWG